MIHAIGTIDKLGNFTTVLAATVKAREMPYTVNSLFVTHSAIVPHSPLVPQGLVPK